ncbi:MULTISPECIES: hypothetical protein [Dyella]|jgi:hypothetical protein|uniref:hypothetical protein n=1 Tax=Dyella TaxID=231454 RepID=UPI000C8148A3|nr:MULTISPECIES: hypothetical protein [Dyella]MDR3444010.1 hypothetical protein [Dyella sp.]PMQ06270.1 hypothetical protein DyAD56_04665 [Dyella sp. AD56]ULU26158.1 hypothetical protein DYST_03103 [Dyella terrae]
MGNVIELKTTGQRAQLREAQEQHQLVRLWRGELEHGSFCGYVGGVGREFFLLWVVGDGITYDGMYVMRHRDVSELEAPDKHAPFMEKALVLKHLMPRPPRGFPLDDIRSVIQAAAAQAPVIGVHVDSEDESEVCYIGRLISVEEDGFNMQEISPDAEWLREASFFSWDEVSTVSIEDGYATSLLAVAGTPPPLEQGDSGVGHAQ